MHRLCKNCGLSVCHCRIVHCGFFTLPNFSKSFSTIKVILFYFTYYYYEVYFYFSTKLFSVFISISLPSHQLGRFILSTFILYDSIADIFYYSNEYKMMSIIVFIKCGILFYSCTKCCKSGSFLIRSNSISITFTMSCFIRR